MTGLLVYRYGGIGDTLVLTPFLASLRARFDRITLIGNRERLELIDPALFDQALSYDLHARSLDRLVAAHRESVSFSNGPMPPFQRRFAPFPPEPRNIYEYMAALGSELASNGASQCGSSRFVPPPASGSGLLVHPGGGSEAKRGSLDFFLEHARRLAERHELPLGRVGFLLGPADGPIDSGRIVSRGYEILRPASLAGLREIVRAHRFFLGNDSGPAHLAALNGLTTYIRFSATSPRVWLPPGAEPIM